MSNIFQKGGEKASAAGIVPCSGNETDALRTEIRLKKRVDNFLSQARIVLLWIQESNDRDCALSLHLAVL